jgi:integrase
MPVHKDETIKSNPWYYAFEVKDPTTGKRRTIKKRGFKTKKDAEYAEAEAKSQWKKGTYLKPSNIPFGEYLYQWLENKQNISDQTRYVNKGHIKNHINPLIGHLTLSELSPSNLETFISNLKKRNLSDSTVKKIYNVVNTALNAAVKRELISKNPLSLLESAPKVGKSKIKCWTPDDIKKFLNGFESRYKIVYKIAIYTGMRMGEILGLTLDDVDLKNKRIYVRQILDFNGKIKTGTKTLSSNRMITIPDILLEDMKEQYKLIENEMKLGGEDYNKERLFICTSKGRPYRKQQLTKSWYKLLEKTGVPRIRFHDLRHTCASLLLSIGTHPKVIQELLGHSSIKITMDLYSHLMPNMQNDAVNALGKLLSE